jgi:hypothetical protein
MGIVLKDKIKVDKTFIDDLIAKSWQDSESIQNQIDSIEVDSAVAAKTVKLLKDLLTSYYVFTGCLENLEREPVNTVEPEPAYIEEPINIPEEPVDENVPDINVLDEFDNDTVSEPFEYFVDFDEPVGEPLTDDDLYN